MTREQWKERLPLIQAFVEGKELSIKRIPGKLVSPTFTEGIDISYYEITTEPKLRPWKMEEVPVGAVLQAKAGGFYGTIIGAWEDDGDVWVDWFGNKHKAIDLTLSFHWRYPHETEWKPCGVEVEA